MRERCRTIRTATSASRSGRCRGCRCSKRALKTRIALAAAPDPGLQSAIKVIKDADVGFGNFESLIRDERTFAGPLAGSMVGTKEVAADLEGDGVHADEPRRQPSGRCR